VRRLTPATRVPATEINPSAVGTPLVSPESRSSSLEAGVPVSESRALSPEARPRTSEFRYTTPEVRVPMPEDRSSSAETPPVFPEYRPSSLDPGVPATESNAPSAEVRPRASEFRYITPEVPVPTMEDISPNRESRTLEPASRLSGPGIRPSSFAARTFTHGSRLFGHASRPAESGAVVPNQEERLSTPEVGSLGIPSVPEAQTAAPEAPVSLPDAHIDVAEPPVSVSEAQVAISEAPVAVSEAPIDASEPAASVPEADVSVAEPPVSAPENYLFARIPSFAVQESPVAAAVIDPAHTAIYPVRETGGRLIVFLGAKGGSGTTSVACGFATALVRESNKKVLLIDLALPLGNVALELGVTAQFSTLDAVSNSERLDTNYFSKLPVRHRSGLYVLASSDNLAQVAVTDEAIDKLLSVARQDFDFVVVDAGARLDMKATALFAASSTIYLVARDGLPELRNANRLISEFFSSGGPKLEIVLNRYTPRTLGIGMYSSHLIDDDHIAKALTRPPDWKIPRDGAETLLPIEGSPTFNVLRQMARAACSLPTAAEEKKKFGMLPKKKGQPTLRLFE
jgi:pilus assembly protein CpaE